MFYSENYLAYKYPEAFKYGQELAKEYDSDNTKVKNPYPKNTEKWMAWNRGWNSIEVD